MSTPGEVLEALESLRLQEVVLDALEEKKEEYVRLNLEQLYEGLNPEGTKITPEYVEGPYRRKKARMNTAPGEGTPDFKLTGALYEETHAQIDDPDITIGSEVEYAKYLEDRWGTAEMWGLDPENHEEFVNEIQPIIIEKVSELTGMT